MKTGWLIYRKEDAERNHGFIDWFIAEAAQVNISLSLILREELTIGITENKREILLHNQAVLLPDFAIVRTIEPLLNLHLEACGITVFNSSKIAAICNHKGLTHHHVHNLHIPMVDTYFFKKEDLPKAPPMIPPFVVKEVGGRGGKQIYLINDQRTWSNCMEALQSEVVIQSANVQPGKDIRVFVVGNEIVGAVLRENKQDFRANFKLGGSATAYELNQAEQEMVLKIINYFDFGMVGIDFLVGLDNQLLFNEIEDVVGSRTLSAVSDINILNKYMAYIKKRLVGPEKC